MRHKVVGRKLNRTSAHREAMLRNMVCSLFEHGRIKTTVPKAKEARRRAERCITYAKKGNAALAAVADQVPPLKAESAKLREQLESANDEQKRELTKQIKRTGAKIAALQSKGTHYRRMALKALHQKRAVNQLFEEVAPRYEERQGGYTRILKAGFRKGDNGTIALFSLV